MTNIGYKFALLALASNGPLHAAQDTGLLLHDTGIGQRGTAVGATVTMRIKLGPEHVVRKSGRVKMGLNAGPIVALPNTRTQIGIPRIEPSLVGFEWKPGYAANLNFAGNSIATIQTRRGAAENETEDSDEGKQSTGEKIGWIALVTGGVMVALLGTYLITCGPGESHSCGSD